MLHTYRAILDEDRVRWLEEPPERSGTVQVHITFLEKTSVNPLPTEAESWPNPWPSLRREAPSPR